MASPAQCYYCFECLAASYTGQEPASLTTVEELWERHEQFKKISALQDPDESVSLRESESLDQQSDDDDDIDEGSTGGSSKSKERGAWAMKLPNISRLQSQISSDSSSATTPSTASSNSSHSVLSSSTVTTMTTPSSQSLQSDASNWRRQREKDRQYPLFVTWNTVSKSGRKSLRGCIGTFETQELAAGLKSYALTSAFEDSRFSPIPANTLPSLSCSLTLLGSFEPCTNALDWILGVHGIRISFIHRGRRYGATYLPDVPVEQGWTKEQTLRSLMDKAGWDGLSEGMARRLLRGSSSGNHTSSASKPWEQVSDFRVVKYQGLKASASYAEWQEWRQWVLSLGDESEQLLDPAR
ncbi:AMMECR1 domain-containing protein [Aspergillus coremiiformis]|uniref:AMMECR1 domain-containing protein n=1 Tax=Aspergillus coremiiformis TaxID=138285 RepID=A0A5N6Z032_9EURO|nr:AMMECR1 domain-containing protein [Aspergillus coremiiformis]